MDEILIVKAKDVLHLNRYRRRWIFGWLVATAALVLATIQTVRVHVHDREVDRLVAMEDRLEDVVHQQAQVNDAFVKAWEAQNHTTELLVSWGTFIKDRTDLVNHNNKNQPFSFVSYKR